MTFDDLIKFVKEEDKRLIEKYGNSNVEKRILAGTVKLSEEVGELSEAILSFLNNQRKDKINKFNKSQLEEELADVIIVALLIAESTNSNIEKALKRKITKILKRYN